MIHADPVCAEPKLFVGGLRFDVTRDEVINRFQNFGPIKSCVLLNHKDTGKSKGCAMVLYHKWAHAEAAVEQDNAAPSDLSAPRPLIVKFADPQRRPDDGMLVGVTPKKLFIGQVPKGISKEQIESIAAPYGEILDCSIMPPKRENAMGCAFVTYSTWAAAEMAIEALNGMFTFPGAAQPIAVKLADAKPQDMQRVGAKRGMMDMMGGGPAKRQMMGGYMGKGGMAGGMGNYGMGMGMNPMMMGMGMQGMGMMGQGMGMMNPGMMGMMGPMGQGMGGAMGPGNMGPGMGGAMGPPSGNMQGAAGGAGGAGAQGNWQQGGGQGAGGQAGGAGGMQGGGMMGDISGQQGGAGGMMGGQDATQAGGMAGGMGGFSQGMQQGMGAMGGMGMNVMGMNAMGGMGMGAMGMGGMGMGGMGMGMGMGGGKQGYVLGIGDQNGNLAAAKAWKLFIGQISFDLAEGDLFPFFSQFGTILELVLLRNAHDRRHRGCGFLVFSSQEEAQNAIQNANNTVMPGDARQRPITVKYANQNAAQMG